MERRGRPGRRGRAVPSGRAERPGSGSLAGAECPPRWGGDNGTDAEDMEGDGAPSWRGPGGGGGVVIRELCRSFGHYNRHLARLQHNLCETKKFFRDVKCSQGHPFPSSAAVEGLPGGGGDGAPPDGPAPGGESGAGPAAGGEACA